MPQYQHIWFDGKSWRHQVVSNRAQPFSLQGRGTLKIPISRPDVVIDRQDNVYIIARGDHTQGRLSATLLLAPDYVYHPNNIRILVDEDVGFAEPIIDRVRWHKENILTLLVQHNEQPNHDTEQRPAFSVIRLIDIQFNLAQ